MAPDSRFFESLGPIALGDLAKAVGARLIDAGQADRQILQVSPLSIAGGGAIAFCADAKRKAELAATGAEAVFVTEDLAPLVPPGCAAVLVGRPQAAWAMAASLLHRPLFHEASEGPIHPSAEIEEGAELGPGVIVGQGVRIGRGTKILSAAVIGPGVAIGRDCWIGAYASIGFALIGDRVNILAGARIGEPGFGVTATPQGLQDIPQLGRAILQDGVTIGANSSVDRGSFEDTVIGENTKLDNLVHVGHSTRLGRNCVAAAYTGISGSVTAGDGVQFGGRAGVADHITVGEGASIAAGGGVLKNVPAGEVWAGYPAKPIRQWIRENATLARLAGGEKARGSKDERS